MTSVVGHIIPSFFLLLFLYYIFHTRLASPDTPDITVSGHCEAPSRSKPIGIGQVDANRRFRLVSSFHKRCIYYNGAFQL